MRNDLILEFTGLYEATSFNGDVAFDILDFRDLSGLSMYIDPESENLVRDKLKPYGYAGLHFIDNGNYHYVSRLFLEKIEKPFSLLVFDNHTDDQEPAFGGMRSCGSWIRDAKEDFKGLLSSVKLYQGVKKTTGELTEGLPVYISVDLDVLSVEELKVNWDQGDMTLSQLKGLISETFEKYEILGIDICGGCLAEDLNSLEGNRRVFEELKHFIRSIYERYHPSHLQHLSDTDT